MKCFSPQVGVALFLSAALCAQCAAQPQVEVSFPLGGYYRPGKYMPVRIRTDAPGPAPVELRADAALGVSIDRGPAGADAVVPWLATGTLREPRWGIAGGTSEAVEATLTPLEPGQALVGVVGADAGAAAVAAPLFDGRSIVPVALAGTPPLPGHPAAWEALDAVVFEQSPGRATLDELTSRGVTVVVRSESAPGGGWDWRGGAGRWFLQFHPAGPQGAIDPAPYEAINAWRPGWPAPLRRRAALLAVVFVIVALAAALWRRSWQATALVVLASIAAAAGFAWWGGRQPMLGQATGVVTVNDANVAQADAWSFARPLRDRDVFLDFAGRKPVFASPRHARDNDLRLHCDPSGRTRGFAWRARSGSTLAFLARTFEPAAPLAANPTDTRPLSPLGELVRQAYLSRGDLVLAHTNDRLPGDAPDWLETWPGVTVRRREP